MPEQILYYQKQFHRLIYYSRATPEVIADLDTVFPVLLEAAVRRNSANQITGALLACNGWFLQILEGAYEKVLQTYDLIRNDRRHSAATVIKAGPVEERKFSNWSMCGQHLSPTDDAILEVLGSKRGFDPTQFNEATALNLLLAVAKIQSSKG